MASIAPPPDLPPDSEHERGRRRRLFLTWLALWSLIIALPLTLLALWWGIERARALAGRPAFEAVCHAPALDPSIAAARDEERELRLRIAALQSQITQRRLACDICPPAAQGRPATEVAIVLDTSLSMRWNADLTAAAESEIERRVTQEFPDLPRREARIAEMQRAIPPEQTRMVAARQALIAAVDAMPPSVNVRFTTFGALDRARLAQTRCTLADVGRFNTTDRAALTTAIGHAEANAAGTPLARAITHAAQGLKDRAPGQPGLIVIVTDGTENCGANVCTAYAEAKQADPELQLTIIDMAGNPQLGCIANAPGGRVLAAARASEAAGMIQQALAPPPPPQSCIPRP